MSSAFFFETGFLSDPGTHCLARSVCQQCHMSLVPPHPQPWASRCTPSHVAFHMNAENARSSSHACGAGTLPNESHHPPPQRRFIQPSNSTSLAKLGPVPFKVGTRLLVLSHRGGMGAGGTQTVSTGILFNCVNRIDASAWTHWWLHRYQIKKNKLEHSPWSSFTKSRWILYCCPPLSSGVPCVFSVVWAWIGACLDVVLSVPVSVGL